MAAAAKARDAIAWYGKNKPEPDPLVALVDAGLALASGLPERALDVAKGGSVRAMLMRGQALLDLGRAEDALAELDHALAASPENIEVQILREWARALASAGKERAVALDALEKVARKAKTKLGRHALGAALLATGAPAADAKKRLEQAVTDVSDEAPNPVAYRTHTLLAEIELGAGNLDAATTQIEAATKANSGYLPALALRARLVLAKRDPTPPSTSCARWSRRSWRSARRSSSRWPRRWRATRARPSRTASTRSPRSSAPRPPVRRPRRLAGRVPHRPGAPREARRAGADH